MGKLPKQTKRRDLIRGFRDLGWDGPHQAGKGRAGDHPEFMSKGDHLVKIPNPHSKDIGEALLKKILTEAGVTVNEWLGEPEEDENKAEGERQAPPARNQSRRDGPLR